MELFLSALLIFALRVCDVSIGTLRTLFTVRGRKYVSASLALAESAIFIFALSRVMKDVNNPIKMIAYALGFATGNFCGITIERWIGSGTILARIVAKNAVLLVGLREQGFGVTVTQGEGREGEVALLFVVAPRRRERELLTLIEQLDPNAFVTLDAVHHALGGYLTNVRGAMSVRK
jgi:uncharacterized protein YebE (UPF0316 family)